MALLVKFTHDVVMNEAGNGLKRFWAGDVVEMSECDARTVVNCGWGFVCVRRL